ncbi:alpha/beta-Hydrolases superfamily protein [Actinidia rufa]|uniref:Alpha/beta-Hydrolases superfamily protein n=1 Tax=Actinidia rufa TaxID=165716 RepID=A0A7J0FE31_9ERIC|nr:alpha/beta-Hydrolases superfamily protein [Actinidia rufa]
MAWALLSPPPLLNLSTSSSSTSYTSIKTTTGIAPPPSTVDTGGGEEHQKASSLKHRRKTTPRPKIHRRSTLLASSQTIPPVAAPFNFPRVPPRTAMLAKCSMIEDKGKDFGSTIKSGKFRWFVRETGSSESSRGTIVFLHGAPTQSYSYRVVMSQMADAGFHCFAPDWIGFGFSDKPQPGYGFDYTEKEFHAEFDKLLEVLGIKTPFFLVVQGFLVGSYGLTWALKNPSKITKLTILNSPLTVSSPIPGLFQQLSYVLKLEKADVYRLPYLSSGGPGFALLEASKKANFKGISSQIAAGFASGSWDKPILVVWGISDKYLPQSVAEEFQKGNPSNVKLKLIEGAGHMPQEDWPEKVVDALRVFF